MKQNVVKYKSFGFAIRIVRLYQFLISEKKEFVLSKQLLREGTSIGAMVREAEQAETKKDFIHKWLLHKRKSTKAFIGWN